MTTTTEPDLSFGHLRSLLGLPSANPRVVELLARASILRTEDRIYATFKNAGISMVLERVDASGNTGGSAVINVAAVHFHRAGHEGYRGYGGPLPVGVNMNDSEAAVVAKLGTPEAHRKAGMIPVLGIPIPPWLRFRVGDVRLHCQFDGSGLLELFTVEVAPPAP